MPVQYQPLDVTGLAQTIQAIRGAKLGEQAQQMQLADLYEARDRRHQIQAALQSGDLEKYRALDPHGYAEMQKANLDATKTRSEIANTQSQIKDREFNAAKAKDEATEKTQQYMSRALEVAPQQASQLQAKINDLASRGAIHHFALPGFQQAPGLEGPSMEPTRNEVQAMQAGSGAESPYDKPTSDQVEYRQAQSEGFRGTLQDWILAQKRAGASQVNVGKDIPASTVNDLSDIDTAIGGVQELLSKFKKMVPTAGVGDQLLARGAAMVPNTETNQYTNDARVAGQVIGMILEGGKLAAGDEHKYAKMLPLPGDSEQTAALKTLAVVNMLRREQANRKKGLANAGFRDLNKEQRQEQHAPGQTTEAQMQAEFMRLMQQPGGH